MNDSQLDKTNSHILLKHLDVSLWFRLFMDYLMIRGKIPNKVSKHSIQDKRSGIVGKTCGIK